MRILIVLIVLVFGISHPYKQIALSNDNNLLFNRIWLLKRIQGVEVPKGSSLIFESQKVTGSTGCNKFWASIEYKGTSKIDIGPPQSARLYCFRAMALERAYLAALESIERFNLNGNTLKMMMEDSDVFLEFEDGPQSK